MKKGNIKRAAQCLGQAEPTLKTMQKPAQLHPKANPPDVDVSDTMPVQTTAEILVKALQCHPRDSSGGASAWTYEHVKAACVCPGTLPAVHEQYRSRKPPRHSRLTSMLAGAP